jgi:enoyl-CoA hydratase/carnithine racemase
MGQVSRILPDRAELHKAALELGREIAGHDPLPLRQAKRAADITMDIQGQHYVTTRMEELLDEAPRFHFR